MSESRDQGPGDQRDNAHPGPLLSCWLGNQRLLNGLGTAFIVALMAYSGYSVLKANVAPVFAYSCFFPAAFASLGVALMTGFGREDRIADQPGWLQTAIRGYNWIAAALIGAALGYALALIVLPFVIVSNWLDGLRKQDGKGS